METKLGKLSEVREKSSHELVRSENGGGTLKSERRSWTKTKRKAWRQNRKNKEIESRILPNLRERDKIERENVFLQGNEPQLLRHEQWKQVDKIKIEIERDEIRERKMKSKAKSKMKMKF